MSLAQAHQLRPGITLSANQVAALTSDIVWLETQTITLPDGSTTQALVPRVYLLPRAGDLSAGGALMAGRDVQLNLSGDVLNSGTIAGRELVQINAQNVLNTGLVSGQTTAISAREDVNNIGGTVSATDALIVQAGRDVNVQTTTARGAGAAGVGRYSSEQVNRVAGLYVSGEAGVLLASAGRDITLNAGESSYQIDHGVYAKSSGLLGSSSTETRTHNSRTDAVASSLGGTQVVIHGGRTSASRDRAPWPMTPSTSRPDAT